MDRVDTKPKVINTVIIDGVKVDMATLPESKRKEIAIKMNHDAMTSLGYVIVENK